MGDFARELLAVFQRDGGFRHIEHAAVHLHLAFLAHDMQHGGTTTRVSRSDLMDVMDWLIASSLEASIPSA